jgi:hypothetical protein
LLFFLQQAAKSSSSSKPTPVTSTKVIFYSHPKNKDENLKCWLVANKNKFDMEIGSPIEGE